MYRIIRTLSLSVLLAAAFAANAQTAAQTTGGGGNPMMRGERNSFFYNGLKGSASAPAPSGNALNRPSAQYGPVTPVPEPSEWAMLLVGLTFVGWIVRRKTKQ
jgi:hypothetical protein